MILGTADEASHFPNSNGSNQGDMAIVMESSHGKEGGGSSQFGTGKKSLHCTDKNFPVQSNGCWGILNGSFPIQRRTCLASEPNI